MIIEVVYTSPKTHKIGAEAIKWYLGTDYSHVAVRWYNERLKRYMVYHAAHGTVHFVSDSYFLENNRIVRTNHLDLSEDQYYKLLVRCMDLAGLPYGYSELGNILCSDLYHKIYGKYPVSQDAKGYICSELLADILESSGYAKFNKPNHLINPKDIYEALNG